MAAAAPAAYSPCPPAAARLPAPAGHHGAIYSLSRNPFFPKFFLSVGDWTTRVWNEDLRAPLVTSPYNASYLTGGAWSPSRPGVFYTICHEGSLEAWDYYYKQREPVLSVKVADRPLTFFALQAGAAPRLVGVGAADGSVTILQLSEGLVEMQDNEKVVISAVSYISLRCSSQGELQAGSSCGAAGAWCYGPCTACGHGKQVRAANLPAGRATTHLPFPITPSTLHPHTPGPSLPWPPHFPCRCWSVSRAGRAGWSAAPKRPRPRRARRRRALQSPWTQ